MQPEELKDLNLRTFAEHSRELVHEKILFAERRSSEVADEFTKLEVQIASILLAFMGFFASSFGTMAEKSIGYSMSLKIIFFISILCIIISLIFGLVHIKRKENFWDKFLAQRVKRFGKWEELLKNKMTLREVEAFYEGSAIGRIDDISCSPKWTWQLQTIFLSVAILLLFILFAIFLFN